MKPVNEMKLSFPAKSINECFARTAVSGFAMLTDPTVEELADLRTAVSEAVTNCIVHAYPENTGEIRLCCRLYEGGRLTVSIKDKGCGIPDIKKARQPLFTTAASSERSGLGFTVMESFCDKVTVRSKPNKGTCVHLTKLLSSKEK